ncbi:MAG: hypothetical protein HWQ38_20390 [Nostoc sp. NMS7]|uniref:hypothetical protein n=1 Tax=Nostoc sp. NMS7 TaxID=2815391 RepID=UPI002600A3CF|nr:hypothetical protein [Nostoc sp. NMS7]MBN3948686.1 hypothetical protein [Nostoc sp. NMS7]
MSKLAGREPHHTVSSCQITALIFIANHLYKIATNILASSRVRHRIARTSLRDAAGKLSDHRRHRLSIALKF